MKRNIMRGNIRKIRVTIIALCLCVTLVIVGACTGLLNFGSKADELDDNINLHKNINRDIKMTVDSSGTLQISKASKSTDEVKMGIENKWTLFIYLLESSYYNDECYNLLNDFKDRYVGENITDCFDIIIQCCPAKETSIMEFEENKQIRAKITTNGFEVLEVDDKSNMAEADTFYDFLNWGVENYASEHMMVSILGDAYNNLNANRGVASDDSYSDGLQIYEIEEAFARQSKDMTCRFDGIIFNENDTGLVEYANLLSPYVEKMVGVLDTSGLTLWDYSIITQVIESNPDVSFDEIAKIICDAYDYQCSLKSEGKEYVNEQISSIENKYNQYERTSYGIGLYDLDKVDKLAIAINKIMYNIYTQLSKSSDIDTLKEFASLSSISDVYDVMDEKIDINTILKTFSKLTKISVDIADAQKLVEEVVIYSRTGEDGALANKSQMKMCVPFYDIDYAYYPADKINFYRNMVISPYILNIIDYMYAAHWDMDVSENYLWEKSKYYFEENFGFIPSNVSIGEHQGDISDDMYTSKCLNENTFIELYEQKYTEYKVFTNVWKKYFNTIDEKRWISLSKTQYISNNKYYAHAFMQFKDLQKYWNAYNAAYLKTDNGYIMLGEQTGVTIENETGMMHSEFNYEWVMLSDGQFVRTNVEKHLNKIIYNIPVYMDDANVSIRVEETIVNDKKNLTVLGVYDSRAKEKIADLESGMIITPIYDVFDIKHSEEIGDSEDTRKNIPWDVEYGEEYTVNGKNDFLYGVLKQEEVICSFAIMKYNGNIYYDVSNVDEMEKACLIAYAENVSEGENYNFEVLNNLLRGKEVGEEVNIDKVNEKIDILSGALKQAQLLEDITLYRGCSKKTLGEYKDLSAEELIGKTIVEPGFLSTSKEMYVAENFGKDLIMTINAKKGAHGLSLKDISPYIQEDEILFDKSQDMVIIEAEEKEGIMYITVTLD